MKFAWLRNAGLRKMAGFLAAAAIGTGATLSTTGSSSRSNVQTIYVRNLSSFVSDETVKNALPAFNAALHQDFAPIWKIDANLVFIGQSKAPVGSSTITLIDKGPVKGALAYHELVNGVPDSIIYTGTSKYYGYSWTVGFTHELWEQLADPSIIHTSQQQDNIVPYTPGTFWATEVADPVESDQDAYTRPGANGKPILISDFITDKWFTGHTAGPYDFANHVQFPLTIDKGGYAQYWTGWSWSVVTNFRGPRDRGFLLGEKRFR